MGCRRLQSALCLLPRVFLVALAPGCGEIRGQAHEARDDVRAGQPALASAAESVRQRGQGARGDGIRTWVAKTVPVRADAEGEGYEDRCRSDDRDDPQHRLREDGDRFPERRAAPQRHGERREQEQQQEENQRGDRPE